MGSAGAPPAVFCALAEDTRAGNTRAVWRLKAPTGANREDAVGNSRRQARSSKSQTHRAWWLAVFLLALSGPVAETAKTEETPPTAASASSTPAASAAAKPPWG